MAKKGFVSLAAVCWLIVEIFVPRQAHATAPLDQYCTGFVDIVEYDVSRVEAFQTFVPTKNTLDAIGMWLRSGDDNGAKVKATVANISSIWDYKVIAEKTISVTPAVNSVLIDFADVSMPPGNYAISLESVHDGDSALWTATHQACYPGGNAVIDYESRSDLDFGFFVYAYDTTSSSNAEVSSDDQGTSSSGSGVVATDQTAAPSQSSISTNDTAASDLTASSKVQKPSDTLKADNAVNQASTTTKPMTDAELAELIAWIKAEQEENRAHGIFGIGGMAGRILTWPAVIAGGGLVLLLIVSQILISRRRSVSPSRANNKGSADK